MEHVGQEMVEVLSTDEHTAFLYDGLGKLRSIGDGTDVINLLRWDTGWNVLGSYQDGDGDWDIGDLEAVFLSRGGVPLGLRIPITEELDLWFHYYHDHLGSTRRLRMDDKSAAAEYEYTPYGDTYLAHGSDQAFRYTGKPRESRTGLYCFPYRFYNPTTARWLTRDPLGMVDGPNLYAYVRGNPVLLADVLGLTPGDCKCEKWAAFAWCLACVLNLGTLPARCTICVGCLFAPTLFCLIPCASCAIGAGKAKGICKNCLDEASDCKD